MSPDRAKRWVLMDSAIIANGVLVTSPEEVEGLGAQNGFLEVTFIFVQAKRSGSFSEAAIGTFALAVKDFFSASPTFHKQTSSPTTERSGTPFFVRARGLVEGSRTVTSLM
jgi:hypothetical protein